MASAFLGMAGMALEVFLGTILVLDVVGSPRQDVAPSISQDHQLPFGSQVYVNPVIICTSEFDPHKNLKCVISVWRSVGRLRGVCPTR